MRLLHRLLGILFIFFFVTGCGPKIRTAKKAPVDMEVFSSYAFLPNQDTISTSRYDNASVNELVIEEINQNMQQLGYRLDQGQPDLLVYYHLMLDEEMAVDADPVYSDYSYYRPGYYVGPYYRNFLYNNYFTVPRIIGTDIDQVPYREGSIVIDLINRRTNEIVWRGKAKDVITGDRLPEELREYINEIFDHFPKP